MAETVSCPECGAKLKLAAMPAPGKKVRCPKCQNPFTPQAQEAVVARKPAAPPPVLKDADEDWDPPATKSRAAASDQDDDDRPRQSIQVRRGTQKGFTFDGTPGGFFKVYLLTFLLTVFTFGLGTPWAVCLFQRWKAQHTLVDGRRLRFDGTGLNLLGFFLLQYLLILVTLGIYMFWAVPKIIRWVLEQTHFADER